MNETPNELAKAVEVELYRAKSANPLYSLRAMAKRLQVSPGTLSELIKEKRNISFELALRIMSQINISDELREKILSCYIQNKDTIKKLTKISQSKLETVQYQVVSEWYHFAILNLIETDNFQADIQWISQRLNISFSQAKFGVENLDTLGLIKILDGKISRTYSSLKTSDNIQSLSLQVAHKKTFELAGRSLESHSVDERDITATTISINKKELPNIKALIRNFHKELKLMVDVDSSMPKEEVYKLSIALFPLTGL